MLLAALRQPRAERRFYRTDDGCDAAQDLVLFGVPARPPIPPGRGGEDGVQTVLASLGLCSNSFLASIQKLAAAAFPTVGSGQQKFATRSTPAPGSHYAGIELVLSRSLHCWLRIRG